MCSSIGLRLAAYRAGVPNGDVPWLAPLTFGEGFDIGGAGANLGTVRDPERGVRGNGGAFSGEVRMYCGT
ncbi:MAG: hypothetical protein R3E01_12950 [Pirellulaceae bacterium]|nr:hypothetical protein [Planctomycetales bacterium]